MIFEGAQGVLLDELHGFQPHTTWSNTTFANANSLLYDYAPDVPSTRLGVLRSYFTRHGRGPLVTECSDLAGVLCEPHNDSDGWPGRFRVGLFDAVAVRYAVAVSGGVDQLAVTHLDRIQALPPKICHSYSLMQEIPTNNRSQTQEQERLTRELFACQPVYERLECADSKQFIAGIENAVSVKVGIGSVGTTANDKYEL